MFKKVLFPVLMNEQTEQMISCMSGLAKNGVEEVLLLHVLSVSELANGNINRKYDEETLIRWKEILEETGIKVSYQIVTGIPWIEIVDQAERGKYSFILIGSHGNSLVDRVLLGSVTENVVQHSTKPIFIFRLKKIMPAAMRLSVRMFFVKFSTVRISLRLLKNVFPMWRGCCTTGIRIC